MLFPLRRSYIPYVLLVAMVGVAFGASLTASFHFDDQALFVDPAVTSADGWRLILEPSQTRPLTYLTFWLNYSLGGVDPAGYHALNLLIHLASVLLLYSPLSKLMPRRAAFLAVALFAIHPIQTEPVVYIYARATLLMGLFCILSLRSWLAGRHWIAVVWFGVALLSKEECAAFPLLLLLLHLSISRNRAELASIGAMLVLALAAGLRVIHVLSGVPDATAGPGAAIDMWQYFSTQGLVILRYLRLLLVPYGFTIAPDIRVASTGMGLLGWAGVLALAGAATRRFSGAREGFWLLAGLVLLLPSSSIFPAEDLAADRRIYLPLMAVAGAAGLVLGRVNRWVPVAVGVVLLALTVSRVQIWQTEQTLWAEAVARSPGKIRPKIQLARASDPVRAIELLENARRNTPDDPRLASELGRRWLELGRAPEALAEFGRALALAPRDPRAHNNRGVALLSLGQSAAARSDFERALQLEPCLFDALFNLQRMGVHTEAPAGCRFTPDQLRDLGQAR